MALIQPQLSDDGLLADIQACEKASDQFFLWWLGQSGFLLQWAGHRVAFDPYLSDSLTKKYAATDKPHVRMTARALDPARLDFIEVVTSSHHHTDHMDAETLVPLLAASPAAKLVLPAANLALAEERLGVAPDRLVGLDDGKSANIAGIEFHAVPAAHDAIELDDAGRHKYLGYILRFGQWTLYHSGDTRLYDGMVDRLRPWKIDVALLPINGASPERRVAGNLDGREAAELAHAIGARLVIPCHYEMFTFNTATPDEFLATAQRLGQPARTLRCGERWSSVELR
jgi:L-ascorbate metabolism protein UlaG (beta-lactamase superfamily)